MAVYKIFASADTTLYSSSPAANTGLDEILEVSVKNDDALVKLAAVVQRLVSANNKADDASEFGLSDEERDRLLREAEKEIENLQRKQE